jgi:AcrR family transcriptional regulator
LHKNTIKICELFNKISLILVKVSIVDKVDRRITRTQKLLTDALITLALEKGYDAVTIKDITERADISYSTFFRRYPDKDKDALLMGILENTVNELGELVGGSKSAEMGGTVLFRHVADNQSLYRVLLGGLNSSAVVQKVQQMTVEALLRDPDLHSDTFIPPEIAANHIAASTLALVKWWLDNNMPYAPERMGTIYAALIIHPTRLPGS